jgi:hypothetical protein
MPLSDAYAARLREVAEEIAPQMPGLSGTEQACVLGIACQHAGISPTWGEWAAFLREMQRTAPERRKPPNQPRRCARR